MTGQELPTEKVREIRSEEIAFLNKLPVYIKVPRAQSKGKTFIKVRWIDHNRGDEEKVNIQSRLVAREFKFLDPYMDGTFAPTPPIEALRYLFHWMATTHRRNGQRLEMKMIVLDVSRAHFHPEAVRECYVVWNSQKKIPWKVTLESCCVQCTERETRQRNGTVSRAKLWKAKVTCRQRACTSTRLT